MRYIVLAFLLALGGFANPALADGRAYPPEPAVAANCGAAEVTADITTYNNSYSLTSHGLAGKAPGEATALPPTAHGSTATAVWWMDRWASVAPSDTPARFQNRITDTSHAPPNLVLTHRYSHVTFVCDNGAFMPYELITSAHYRYGSLDGHDDLNNANPRPSYVNRQATLACDAAQMQCAGDMPVTENYKATTAMKQWLDKIIIKFHIAPRQGRPRNPDGDHPRERSKFSPVPQMPNSGNPVTTNTSPTGPAGARRSSPR